MRWFCTDGWLNSTTLLSHSTASKKRGENRIGEKKKKKLSNWDKDNLIEGEKREKQTKAVQKQSEREQFISTVH